MPTDSEGPERGLKAGAAVYFGFDAEYCVHEAVNTLEGQREEQGLPRQSREEMAKSVVCVCAEVELGRVLLFSNYRVSHGWCI